MVSLSTQPTFTYVSPAEDRSSDEGLKLCLEIGESHISYIIGDTAGKKIDRFSFYPVPKEERTDKLASLFRESEDLAKSFAEVILINNTHQSVLVPERFHKDHLNETILQTIHGDLVPMSVHHDSVHQWEINLVHGIPLELENMVLEKFPQTRAVHFTTTVLRSSFRNMDWEDNQCLKIYFFSSTFYIILFNGEQLQLAQHFHYQTTEDVIYHILNVADKFGVDVTAVLVQVAGMLDESSPIWHELQRHFLEINLEPPVSIEVEGVDIPVHYFTPFFMIPACV